MAIVNERRTINTGSKSSEVFDKNLMSRQLITRNEADTTAGLFKASFGFLFTTNNIEDIHKNPRWEELQTAWEDTILIPLAEATNKFLKENEDVFMKELKSYSCTTTLGSLAQKDAMDDLLDSIS